jgi:hypothetical protein
MNSDLKTNWNDVILPLLSLPKLKKSIKKGITSYINDGNCYKDIIYDPNKCPAFYQSSDGWVVYIDDYENKLIEKFLETGFLRKDDNEPLTNDDGEMNDYFESSK